MKLSIKPLKAAVSFTKLPNGTFTVGMRCRSGGASHELAVDDALAQAAIDASDMAAIACADGCSIVVAAVELRQRTTRQLSFVVDTSPDGQAHVVVPGRLFVGSQDAATNRETLLQHGITQILNVGPDIGAAASHDDGVTRLHVQIIDLPDARLPLGADFAPLRAFIEAAPTLCHCNAGVSRSVSICIAFLLETRRCSTVDEALALVRTTRPSARPNDGFLQQLRQRERELATENAQR